MTKYVQISTGIAYLVLLIALFADFSIIYLIVSDRADIICNAKPASYR